MANTFSTIFDLVILSGVTTFIAGWILGECGIKLTERRRVVIFITAMILFSSSFILGALPPLPRIW